MPITAASGADWTKITASITSTSVNRSMGTNTAPTSSTDDVAIHRFFDKTDGTHFYTASTAERDALVTNQSSVMKFEGVVFYENATPQARDTAVYRFFDTNHGTHLFTQSASEKASILSTRPDLVSERIAFYASN